MTVVHAVAVEIRYRAGRVRTRLYVRVTQLVNPAFVAVRREQPRGPERGIGARHGRAAVLRERFGRGENALGSQLRERDLRRDAHVFLEEAAVRRVADGLVCLPGLVADGGPANRVDQHIQAVFTRSDGPKGGYTAVVKALRVKVIVSGHAHD